MINLLPDDKKSEINAAHTNVLLVQYIIIILFATAFVVGAMYATKGILAMTKASSEEIIASNDLKADVYAPTKAQVDALSASLAESKLLLDQETQYSKVLINIAQVMPPGTLFGKLTLEPSSFSGTPMSAKVYAKTSADAVALRKSFEGSPMFTAVSFQTIAETGSDLEDYPVSVDMTFTLTKAVSQ